MLALAFANFPLFFLLKPTLLRQHRTHQPCGIRDILTHDHRAYSVCRDFSEVVLIEVPAVYNLIDNWRIGVDFCLPKLFRLLLSRADIFSELPKVCSPAAADRIHVLLVYLFRFTGLMFELLNLEQILLHLPFKIFLQRKAIR